MARCGFLQTPLRIAIEVPPAVDEDADAASDYGSSGRRVLHNVHTAAPYDDADEIIMIGRS